MMVLLKLFIAHILGDFFLQPEKWVLEKEQKKLASPKLYFHILIHLVLLFLLVWDITQWSLILCIVASHLIIDALKLTLQNEKNKRWIFFIDQGLHVIALVGFYYLFSAASLDITKLFTERNVLLFTCLLFLTFPVSIFMRTIFSKWDIQELTKDNESLNDAGKYIGILERVLVFIFIIVGHWEAVGFLIAAKSVFRFGDLTASKHRKLTEYILIGTLISFGIAIITALLFEVLQ